MAELGALSLRIETVGDKQALTALDAIDVKAKGVSGTEQKLTASQKALNREIAEGTRLFALQGRTIDATSDIAVSELRASAAAQKQWLQQIGASTIQQEQFNRTVQQFEQRIGVFGGSITNAQGRVNAFGRSGLNAFNALAFGMSQMAATGTASFRSLATSMSSVLSFFGPQGAIAAGVVATGLVMFDFLSRTKKGAEEAATALDKLIEAGNQQFRTDQPVTVARLELSAAQRAVDRANTELERKKAEIAALDATPRTTGTTEEALAATVQRESTRARLLSEQTALTKRLTDATFGRNQAQRQLNNALTDEGDRARQVSDAEVAALGKALASGKATNAERQRATVILQQSQFALDALNKANQQDAKTSIQRAEILGRMAVITDALKEAEKRHREELEKKDKLIAAEIAHLEAISKQRALTGEELVRLTALESQAADERTKTQPTLEREAELWERITKARAAAGRAIPTPALRDKPLGGGTFGESALGGGIITTEGVVGPAKTLPLPNIPVPTAAEMQAVVTRTQANFDAAVRANLEASLAASIAAVITNGIAAGFAEGLSKGSFAEGFKAMAGAFSAGLGGLLVQIGQDVIVSSKLIAAAVKAISSLNPFAALAAGIALVALGSALRGKGGGRGGAGVGSGYGGGGGSGGGLDTIRSFVTGSDSLRALTDAPKGLRDTIGDLRRSTFGSSAIGALSPRSSLGSMATAGAPANPWSGMQFLVVNSPSGQAFVTRDVVNAYNRDRGGR